MPKNISKIIIAVTLLVSVLPQPTNAATLKNVPNNTGLLVQWNFDEGKGTKAGDSSGNGNTATLAGAATWVSGKHGNALSFDGTSSALSFSNVSISANNAFTYSLWIKPNSQSSTYGNIGTQTGTSGFWYRGSAASGNAGKISFFFSGTDHMNNTPLTNNQWNHFVASYNGTTMTYYLNGVQDGSATFSTITITYNRFGTDVASTEPFKGTADDVRIYNRALSATDVSSLYSTGQVTKVVANNTGLVGQWNFDAGKGTKAIDSSGYGNTATFHNSPAWVNGKHGNALSFVGANTTYVQLANTATAIPDGSDMTLVAWVKPTALAQQGIVSNWSAGSPSTGFDMGMTSAGKLRCAFGNGTSGTFFSTATLTLTANQWNFVTCVRNTAAANVIPYLNANAGSTLSLTGNATGLSLPSTTIGMRADTGDKFTGLIDDVRIYSRTLSATEISNLYFSGQTAKNVNQNSKNTNGLVGFWSFNGPDMTVATSTDVSGNGNNGTLINGPTLTAGKIGQGMNFLWTSSSVQSFIRTPSALSGIADGNSPVTMTAWIKPSAFNSDSFNSNVIACVGTDTAFPSAYGIGILSTTHKFEAAFPSGGGVVISNAVIPTTSWTFVAGVYDKITNKVYVNGAFDNSVNFSSANLNISGGKANIGEWCNYPASGHNVGFTGTIDEVRIYNRALSASEVAALYAAGK